MHKIKFAAFFILCFAFLSGGFTAKAAWAPSFTVQSNAVYCVNEDTGSVIYSKNANSKVSPASITKLMTAILTVENIKNLDETVTVTHEDIDPLYGTDSSTAGLVAGEKLTVRQLLYCLLLPSSNETANCLARVVGGNVTNFVSMMNQKAAQIGAKNTHYANPHGLTDSNHYTTAYDTYLIAKYAMKYDVLRKIVDTTTYTLPATNKDKKTKLMINTNKLIFRGSKYYYEYCQGIKTGHTDDAGNCIVSYAKKGDYTYYCVVLGAPVKKGSTDNIAMTETKKIYEWAFSTFKSVTLVSKDVMQTQINVRCAWNKDKLLLYPQKDFSAFVPANTNLKTIKLVSHLPEYILAPVKSGQAVGTADVYLGKMKMGTLTLIAKDNVERNQPLYLLYIVRTFSSSKFFKVICATLAGLFVAYLITVFTVNQRKKRHRDLMRRRRKYTRYR